MKELLYNVPYQPVPKGSNLCQVAAIRMLSGYYGEEVTTEDVLQVVEKFRISNTGMHSQAIPYFFLKKGYRVYFQYFDLEIITPDFLGNEKDIETKVYEELTKDLSEYKKTKLTYDLDLLQKGIDYGMYPPSIKTLDSCLEKGPVSILVQQRALTLHEGHVGNHVIVIGGKRGREYAIFDSSENKERFPYYLHEDRVLFAWSQSSGYLTSIQK